MDKMKVNFYFDNGLAYKEILVPKLVNVGVSPEGNNVIEFKMESDFYQKDIDKFFKDKKIEIHTSKINDNYSVWIDIVESYIKISGIPNSIIDSKNVNLHLLLENNRYKFIKIPLI